MVEAHTGLGLLKALADEAPNVDAGAHRIRPLRAELQRVARADVFPALLQATGVDEVLAAWLQHGSESSLHDLLGGVDAPAFSKLTSVRTAVSTLDCGRGSGGGLALDDARRCRRCGRFWANVAKKMMRTASRTLRDSRPPSRRASRTACNSRSNYRRSGIWH